METVIENKMAADFGDVGDTDLLELTDDLVKDRPSADSFGSSRKSNKKKRQNNEVTIPKLEEQITDDSLKRLHQVFVEADEDGHGGLNIDEFTKAMQKTMPGLDEGQLNQIFMKVDTNCDGTLDWDEYMSYMLIQYKEKDQMTSLIQDRPFPKPVREVISNHRDDITSVAFMPNLNRTGHWVDDFDYSHGRYLTVSKEGVVNFWSIDFNHIRTHQLAEYTRGRIVWITCMVTMANINMIALSSTDREISIFDITASKFDLQYSISGLDDCPLCMDFWFNHRNTNQAVLVWGDAGGDICAITFSECIHASAGCLFGLKNSKATPRNNNNLFGKRLLFPELLSRVDLRAIKAYRLRKVHNDWVSQVKYYPTLNGFLSCSSSASTCMFMGNFRRPKRGHYFTHRKGILCFDYCKVRNIIVTGGIDHMVGIWNPYVSGNSLEMIKGHEKAVIHVVINTTKEQIISISKDKSIRIHNMGDQTCAQYIPGYKLAMGPHVIGSVFFNPAMQSLLLASTRLAILEKADDREVEATSHNAPVFAALYNKLFGQIVSACSDSVVGVWDVTTGEKVIQFANAHYQLQSGVVLPVEITAMTFDKTLRRLITGARDGTMKIWNFNNGACLREYFTHGGCEITGLVCPNDKILVTGWNRRITVYPDSKNIDTDELPIMWNIHHHDDIQTLAYNYSNNTVATSSYDGDVIVWSIESGTPLFKMNAFVSTKAVTRIPFIEELPGEHSVLSSAKTPVDSSNSNSKILIGGKEKMDSVSEKRSRTYGKRYDDKSSNPNDHINDTIPSSVQLKPEEGKSKDSILDRCNDYDTSTDQLLFLSKRGVDKETATVISACVDGWLRAWSPHPKGGLLGQFVAAHDPGASISSMAVDDVNELMVTGDTDGYLRTWDISEYCISREQLDRLIPESVRDRQKSLRRKNFTFPNFNKTLKTSLKCGFNFERFARPPTTSQPDRTVQKPYLLNSFRAHCKPILHIELIDSRHLIVTSSEDCSVRLWSRMGRFIGTFGQSVQWTINEKGRVNESKLPSIIPTDVDRVASTTTRHILKPIKNKWALAKNVLMFTAKLHTGNAKVIIKEEEVIKNTTDTSDDTQRGNEEAVAILGKYNYASKIRHRMMPTLPPIKHCHNNQVSVFSSLPFADLEPVIHDGRVKEIISRHRSSLHIPGNNDKKTPLRKLTTKVGLFKINRSHTSTEFPPKVRKRAHTSRSRGCRSPVRGPTVARSPLPPVLCSRKRRKVPRILITKASEISLENGEDDNINDNNTL